MLVPHYAKRSLAALALTAMVACGGDSNGPDTPFDPAGTSADVEAMGSAFDSPATAGFSVASDAIAGALQFSPPAAAAMRAMPTKSLVGGKPGAKEYAVKVAQAYRQPSAAAYSTAASVPAEYLGVTFVYNAEINQYEPSELTGAPADGVRFLVYAINPISGLIIEPVVEVGYADIVVTESASAGDGPDRAGLRGRHVPRLQRRRHRRRQLRDRHRLGLRQQRRRPGGLRPRHARQRRPRSRWTTASSSRPGAASVSTSRAR